MGENVYFFIVLILSTILSIAAVNNPKDALDDSYEERFKLLIGSIETLQNELKDQRSLSQAQNNRMRTLENVIQKQDKQIETLGNIVKKQEAEINAHNEFIETLTISDAELLIETKNHNTRIKHLENLVKGRESAVDAQNNAVHLLEQKVDKLSALVGESSEAVRVLKIEITDTLQGCRCSKETDGKRGMIPPKSENGEKDETADENARTTNKKTSTVFLRRQSAIQTQNVAFTVYLDRTVAQLGLGQRIPFNKVLLNDGNGFNAQRGVFSCPRTGVYLFIFNINSYAKGEIDAKLLIDGKNQLDAVASAGTGVYEMSGNTAVLRVTVGQSVWVANHWLTKATLVNTDNFRYTSFSGVLLYPD